MSAITGAAMATALGVATPAFAAITVVQQTGPDLSTKIYAAHDGSADIGSTVFGTTTLNSGHDTQFTGYSNFNIATNTGTTTTIDITGGSGFAQVADHDYTNPTGQDRNPATNDLFQLLFDPAPSFYLYEFSVQTQDSGQNLNVFYWLTGGSMWILATGSPLQNGSGDTQYIVGDRNDLSLSIDKVLISSNSPIEHAKQNSIQFTGTIAPVPEPGTWALMLLGFAGVGAAMRRNRKSRNGLMQIA